MTPVAEWSVLTESAPAELDLAGNVGHGRLDRVPSVIQDHDRALDDDGAGGFKRQGDELGGGVFGHNGKWAEGRQGAKAQLSA